MSTAKLDLLLIGATGFTGRRTAAYLAERAPGLRLGLLGRDPAKLEALGIDAERLVVNLDDREAVSSVVARARVVASTAGPFSKFGDHVVDACAEHGVHYCDITGETTWVRRVIDRHHERTRASGTRLVPCSGFDSVPADLGVLALARQTGVGLAEVSTTYSLRGGLNGGTLASALHLAQHEDASRLADPWLLVPGAAPTDGMRERQRDPRGPLELDGRWVAPFFMGPINRRVVQRTHALFAEMAPPGPDGAPLPLGEPAAGYGESFRYREWQATSGRLSAHCLVAGLGCGAALVATRAGRWLARKLGPEPGQGPSEATLEKGRTNARHHAVTDAGEIVRLNLDAKGDPGNAVTVRILGETALALVDPPARLELGAPGTGGVLTPALALGDVLADRLARTGDHSLAL